MANDHKPQAEKAHLPKTTRQVVRDALREHTCWHDPALPDQMEAAVERLIVEREAQVLREAAQDLGSGPQMRVLMERESCDWWNDRPVAAWLRERADRLTTPPGTTPGGAAE